MININVQSDLNKLSRGLAAMASKQVTFATAQALNAVAVKVKESEQDNIKSTFAKPTPFTKNAIAIRRATKANPVAVVYMRDLTAKYLAPYETGGLHVLPGKALFNPKNIRLNQYGQLSKSTLATLKARPDIFIGPVQTKSGIVNGVWQRPYIRAADASSGMSVAMRKKMRGQGRKPRGSNTTGKLKLLIRFGDAIPVKKRLNYGTRAEQVVSANLVPEFDRALTAAMASAR